MRLNDIDRLTGLAILFVVIGHLATGETVNAEGMQWYKTLKGLIYSFHMPLFMFVSGFIFFYTYKPINTFQELLSFYRKKFLRLFPSFLFFALLIFLSKFLLSRHLTIDNPVRSWNDFYLVFYEPSKSYAGFLWYIYVLFEFYLIFPILIIFFRNNLEVLIIPAFFIYWIPFTTIFSLNYVVEYFFFFLLGCIASKHLNVYLDFIDKNKMFLIAIFITSLIVILSFKVPKIVTGLLSIPALHALVRLPAFVNDKFLILLGKYTFSIYLMNTLSSGFIKGLLFKYTNLSYNQFYIVSIIMVLAGIFIPILVKKYIFNNLPFFKSYIG